MNLTTTARRFAGTALAVAFLFGIFLISGNKAQAQFRFPGSNDRQNDRNDRDDRQNNRDDRYGDRNDRNNDRYRNQMYRVAERNGRNDGMNAGADDGRDRDRYNPQKASDYKRATNGYDSSFRNKDAYKQAYREAFVRGYNEGYERSKNRGGRRGNRY